MHEIRHKCPPAPPPKKKPKKTKDTVVAICTKFASVPMIALRQELTGAQIPHIM